MRRERFKGSRILGLGFWSIYNTVKDGNGPTWIFISTVLLYFKKMARV